MESALVGFCQISVLWHKSMYSLCYSWVLFAFPDRIPAMSGQRSHTVDPILHTPSSTAASPDIEQRAVGALIVVSLLSTLLSSCEWPDLARFYFYLFSAHSIHLKYARSMVVCILEAAGSVNNAPRSSGVGLTRALL